MPGGRFRPYKFQQADEDRAAAPAHLCLLLLMPLVWWWGRPAVPRSTVLALILVSVGGFVLFSWLLKWQYWHVRLVIPLPALLAPVFGWAFGVPRLRIGRYVAAAFLVVTVAASVNSLQRPLWGPKSIFSADPLVLRSYLFPNRVPEYKALVEVVAAERPATIGFMTGPASPDYPVQRLLLDQIKPAPRLMAFNSRFAVPGRAEPDPDVLLVARYSQQRVQHQSTGTWYRQQIRIGRYALFVRDKTAAPAVEETRVR